MSRPVSLDPFQTIVNVAWGAVTIDMLLFSTLLTNEDDFVTAATGRIFAPSYFDKTVIEGTAEIGAEPSGPHTLSDYFNNFVAWTYGTRATTSGVPAFTCDMVVNLTLLKKKNPGLIGHTLAFTVNRVWDSFGGLYFNYMETFVASLRGVKNIHLGDHGNVVGFDFAAGGAPVDDLDLFTDDRVISGSDPIHVECLSERTVDLNTLLFG